MIKNNKKGFTLIELLVVIAIIGILSGTVIVSMSGAQDSAKNA
ncbi:MAG TPA: type II secretion system protein, partial [Candidatus Pacearchaeota archaeon]|nr:type II secretion system protein [Candidatus Pacearchaeota archaeon]